MMRTSRLKSGLAAVLLLLACTTILSTARVRTQGRYWAATYGGRSWEEAWSIAPTSDGGCAAAGWTYSFGAGEDDFWALKLSPDGSIEWEKTYGGYAGDTADLIIQTSDGGYAIIGFTESFGAGALDVWLLKLAADGSIQWQKTYGGSADDEAVSVQETLDGGYVVAGETRSFGEGDWDIWVLKLDSVGTVEWQHTYGGRGRDTCSADPIVQTRDGGFVVTGRTSSYGAGERDVWVLKLDQSGAIAWQKTYGGRGYEEAHSIRQTVDGGYAVAAFTSTFGAGSWDIWVLKLDQSGAVVWQKTIGGPRDDVCWSVHQTVDGGCVVTGSTNSFGAGGEDVWVLKLSAQGSVEWQRTYGGREDDHASLVRQASDGGYWLGGGTASFGAGRLDVWMLRLDERGTIPGCALGTDSNATIRNTSVVGVDSTTAVSDSDAAVADTRVSAVDSAASLAYQCGAPPTPTPVYGIFLPIVMKRFN
jgi:hypothetical protein